MRKTENQTTDTSYHNSPSEASQISQSVTVEQSTEPEKSAKLPYDRIAAARKCAEARTQRRNKALAAFSLGELLTRLELANTDGPICAACKGIGMLTLNLDKQTFRCQACKFKGGKLQLVKKAKSLSDWEAIGFLEKLAAEAPENPGSEDKPAPPSLVQALKDGVLAATSQTPKSKAVGRSQTAAKEENLAVSLPAPVPETIERSEPTKFSPLVATPVNANAVGATDYSPGREPALAAISPGTQGVTDYSPGQEPALAAARPGTQNNLPLQRRGEDWEMETDGRNYRIRGMGKNLAYDTLRVNLRVMWGEKFFMDQVDMSQARQRTGFIHQSSQELGVSEDILKREVGKLLLALEELQDRQIKGTLKIEAPKVKMSVEEEREALSFLRSKDLVKRIVRDFHTCGLVGEEMNSLVGYLSAISRKLDDPLALIIKDSRGLRHLAINCRHSAAVSGATYGLQWQNLSFTANRY